MGPLHVSRKDALTPIPICMCWYTSDLKHCYGKTYTKTLTVAVTGERHVEGRKCRHHTRLSVQFFPLWTHTSLRHGRGGSAWETLHLPSFQHSSESRFQYPKTQKSKTVCDDAMNCLGGAQGTGTEAHAAPYSRGKDGDSRKPRVEKNADRDLTPPLIPMAGVAALHRSASLSCIQQSALRGEAGFPGAPRRTVATNSSALLGRQPPQTRAHARSARSWFAYWVLTQKHVPSGTDTSVVVSVPKTELSPGNQNALSRTAAMPSTRAAAQSSPTRHVGPAPTIRQTQDSCSGHRRRWAQLRPEGNQFDEGDGPRSTRAAERQDVHG